MFRMVANIAVLLAFLLVASGCTTGTVVSIDGVRAMAPTSFAEVSAGSATIPDLHDGVVRIVGPPVFSAWNGQRAVYRVHGTIDPKRPGEADGFRIVIVGLFPKRVFLDQVVTYGRPLQTKVYDRERVNCGYRCSVVETLFVTVSEADLRRWAVSGLPLKVKGRRTQFTMFIPAAYFRAVLEGHRLASRTFQG